MLPLFALQFDATIHLSDLIAYGGLLALVWKIFLQFRDDLREVKRALGSDGPPPSGLIADVRVLEIVGQEHRDWLIRAGLDRRSGRTDRRFVGYGADMHEDRG